MKGYFNNPEIRKSSIILIAIMMTFILTGCIAVMLNNQSLKRDYIGAVGGITSRILEENPELEEKILPLLTRELTEEEVIRGGEILRQYGLSENLNTSLFPYLGNSFRNNILVILIPGLALTALLFYINYTQYAYFYKNMREFNFAAKRVVEGDYSLKMSEKREGDLSKLAQSFNSMGEVIRGNIYALRKEKEFLVDLLSDISHQLKTPLSTMILYNDIMLTKELSEEQQKTFLMNTQNQLHRMRWLIQNLLKLAKIDADAIELEMEEQSLNETLEEAIEALESKAVENGVDIDFTPKKDMLLKYDRLWMQEALINVVKNAIEHSHQGSRVSIDLEDNPIFTRIIVRNMGDTIPEDELANIFKRFYKGKGSKKSDSIGIGLSLAKSIIERHGGYIEAKSDRDEGTSFIITFLKY